MDLVDEMFAVAAALERAGVGYAVCGGVAVTAYGAPRSTDDLDLLVRPEDIPRALEAVRPLGYAFAALPLVFDEGTPNERHVQRVTKVEGGQHLVLDLLHAAGPFADGLEGAVVVVLPGGALRLIRREALVAMKTLAGRNKDLADLEALAKVSEDGDAQT